VQADNGSCPSARILVTATVSTAAADPVTTPNSRCDAGTVELTATSPDPVIWYDAPTGGNQVGTGLSFTTPSLTTTTTYYAQADNGCVSNRVAAIATINPLPDAPVTIDAQSCGADTVLLSATATDPITWFDSSAGGTQVGSGNSLLVYLTATTSFYAETNDGTCSSLREEALAVILPLPSVNLGNDTALSGNSLLLDAGPGNTYLWSTGENTQTITVLSSDTFCVTVTDNNSCSNSDCIAVDLFVGLKEITNQLYHVYPNPSSGKFYVQLTPDVYKGNIEVRSISGALIYSSEIKSAHEIDLSGFAEGVYLLQVNTDEYTDVRRIILQ
jgi:hypothetical protein